jgi:hypothetical protein
MYPKIEIPPFLKAPFMKEVRNKTKKQENQKIEIP